MSDLPCRRCSMVSDDQVVIYGRDQVGALVAKAAECRGRRQSRQQVRESGPSPGTVVTVFRPGKCSGCTWDIVPGGKIVHGGEGAYFHLECAPPEDPRPQPRHRERVRTRQA